jgi:hypothetical protein
MCRPTCLRSSAFPSLAGHRRIGDRSTMSSGYLIGYSDAIVSGWEIGPQACLEDHRAGLAERTVGPGLWFMVSYLSSLDSTRFGVRISVRVQSFPIAAYFRPMYCRGRTRQATAQVPFPIRGTCAIFPSSGTPCLPRTPQSVTIVSCFRLSRVLLASDAALL